ncbi:hypothetical protein [Streptomyces sp. H51]|uniref:hypothetical protein n=1 Tax=Streptomyces sp. H51 TaxID=3111770 RepID=UPI002D784B14|nr:hypothetical protein [Streptomyces sp. H51]
MTEEDPTMGAARGKDRAKWMARFQVRPAVRPGVDRAVVLRTVEEATAHRAEAGQHPHNAFGDPDACAVQAAERLVPADRAARAKRHDAVVAESRTAFEKAGDIAGLQRRPTERRRSGPADRAGHVARPVLLSGGGR